MLAKIIIPYFGKLPWWINFFLLSCRYNKDINWTIFTDSVVDDVVVRSKNVNFKHITFNNYKKLVAEKLRINFNPETAVKVCDLKPFLGFIHSDEIIGYKYWGFGDLDVIYGDISDYLSKIKFWNIVSFHDDRISGHLAFFKNLNYVNRISFQHPEWKSILEQNDYVGFDENHLSRFLCRKLFKFSRGVIYTNKLQPQWLLRTLRKIRFKEEFTTPLTGRPWRDGSLFEKQPNEWKWDKGIVYACRDKMKSPYLHLMDFKQSQWNTRSIAPWSNESIISKFSLTEDTFEFYIHKNGISPSL